jgi:4-alpha-glucanotransferase
MVTDLFGRKERFNLPGVGTGNWTQRLHRPIGELDFDPELPSVPELLSAAKR